MKQLHAGPLLLGYENGFLRRVSYSNAEVVRMIYFALRDHNWNTLPHRIVNEKVVANDNHFEITYDCYHYENEADVMHWSVSITGLADGTISFEIQGKALRNFRKNRAGFCLLHPLNVAGTPCSITHDNGSTSSIDFPIEVSPDNPFKHIRTMQFRCEDRDFFIGFEGDIFETEDQRNWGDASYKTFCTPLDKPFPVELKAGDTVFQRITFKPVSPLAAVTPANDVITFASKGAKGVVPVIGFGASSEVLHLPDEAVKHLKALRPGHYRIDLYPASETFVSDFSRECENAYSLGTPIEAILHVTENFAEELEAFSVICLQNKVRLKKVLLLNNGSMATHQNVIDHQAGLKRSFPRVLFGAGTDYNFNELNKNRFRASELDFVSFSMNPQEHASDDLTILENSESLAYLVNSARAIYGPKTMINVSPLTLRKRSNPYATNPADFVIDESKKADPRQKQTLCAAWTFGAIASLAKGNAAAVTLYQTLGHQGILDANGSPYPVYDAVKVFAPFQGRTIELPDSSHPLEVTAVVLDGKVLALANMTGRDKRVRWNDKEFLLSPWQIATEKI